MTDNNYLEIEERLFLLLDTVEKQAEDQAEQKKVINELIKKLDKKVDTFTDDANKKVDITQKRFDAIVFHSVRQILEASLPTLINEAVSEQVDFTPVATALDDAVKELNQQINGNSSVYKAIQKHNIDEIKDTARVLTHQKNAVMKEHYKLLAIVSGGIFLIFFLFFWVMYAVTVPSQSELESLKQEKAQLLADINQIKINRSEWIRDAQKNGYLNR